MIERTRNTVATTNTVRVTLNASTSTTVFADNEARTIVIFTSDGNQDIWIKEQAASVDNLKEGILISAGERWTTPVDNVYVGEISAIAAADGPDIVAVERLGE